MKKVFIDTSAWIALVNKSDKFYQKSIEVQKMLIDENYELITSDYILVEIANGLSKIKYRDTAINLVNSILTSSDVELIRINDDLFYKSWELFSSRDDKDWGFTDCSSFIVMNEYGIKEAFSADVHFKQAGFIVLL
jgi:hypothetical protein